ncbi:DUF2947 domain-containing protein [Neptunomonas antarctica]|uniref:DUF2947 domain-containing protein n=1 Tax=Neptunomonas antarctica TaxID=619304 RepID=A0A1N7KXT0_9GAMM|nr:DUF2947 domain-containing protein [Neptunomonas antarctica]SIS66393.1 Protein of unknown function [Neptunomonas antarctica]
MNYIPLNEYRHLWFYQHQDMPISADDLSLIKPMTVKRASEIWALNISQDSLDASELAKDDWANQAASWDETGFWQSAWEGDADALPELVDEYIGWEGNSIVYFCYSGEHVVETTWDIFRKHWKNFLFLDDGPLLIGKKRKEAIQFQQNGSFTLGKRP